MLGALAGDMIGSVYEAHPVKERPRSLIVESCWLTDDSVMTCACAEQIVVLAEIGRPLAFSKGKGWAERLKDWFGHYPKIGYGPMFKEWAISDDIEPYGSFGNGSAMRVAPIGWAYQTLKDVQINAEMSAEATHNHPEGIKGAQAIAACVFLARKGWSKSTIGQYVKKKFYPHVLVLADDLDKVRREYEFDATCQGSVPQSIACFLASHNWRDAVELAVSLGGDTDTMACMTGAIAEAFYGGVPEFVTNEVFRRMDERMTEVVLDFCSRFCLRAVRRVA